MYVDANGNEFESYEAACYYYGADTPAQIAAEEEWMAAEYAEELMDRMYAGEVQPGALFDPFAGQDPFGDPEASLDRWNVPL